MGHSLLLILTPLYGRSPLKISDHDDLKVFLHSTPSRFQG